MGSAVLSRRFERVVGHPPLSELGGLQRREFHEALLDADAFEDLPRKWQAAILRAEQNLPRLRGAIASRESAAGCPSSTTLAVKAEIRRALSEYVRQ